MSAPIVVQFLECFGGPMDGQEIVAFGTETFFPAIGGAYLRGFVQLPALGNRHVEMWVYRRARDA